MSQRPLSAFAWLAMLTNVGAKHLVEMERNNGRHVTIPQPVSDLLDALEALARAEGVTSVMTESTGGVTPTEATWVSYETAQDVTGLSRRSLQRRVADSRVDSKVENGRTWIRRETL
jgi:hypothetical protein